MRFALAYVRKKQYLCREICSFAALASENMLKNIFLTAQSAYRIVGKE